MTILLTIIHVLVCVFLVIVVLLQSGKAADLAGAFGGMGSQTAFGPRGAATVLSKATTIAAGVFMVTSLSLAILATRNAGAGTSVLDRHAKPATQQQKSGAPAAATPAPTTPPAGAPAAVPVPGAPTTPGAGVVGGGQPMVEYTNEKGEVVRREPIDVSKMPRVDPSKPVGAAPGAPKPAPAR